MVEQDDRSEQVMRLVTPVRRLALQHRIAQRPEPIGNLGIQRIVLDEMPLRPDLIEPEVEDFARLCVDFARRCP